jgi:16S rRNA (guanine(966)-N(2))-methyltransferase RsmD
VRIIGGKYKGKSIIAPKNLPVRPTTDFAKESLFNILRNQIDYDSTVLLELFAGTGNIGYEFASRGCESITSVDLNFNCVRFIKKINRELDLKNTVIRSDAFRYIKSCKNQYNFIFADPPYNLENIGELPQLYFQQQYFRRNRDPCN